MIYFENKNRVKMGSATLNTILHGIKNGLRFNCTITLPKTHQFHSFKMKDLITYELVDAIRKDDFSKIPLQSGYYLELTDDKPKFHNVNGYTKLEPPTITIQDIKDALPCVVFSVNRYNVGFDKFKPLSKIEDINTLSGYLCIDIDDLPAEDLETYKSELFQMFSYVKAIFTSPSGTGLKMIIKYNDTSGFLNHQDIKMDVYTRKDVYHELNMNLFNEIFQNTGIICDPDAIDMNRLCYISFDRGILIKNDEEVVPYSFNTMKYRNKIITSVKELKKTVEKERSRIVIPEIKEGDAAKFLHDMSFFIDYMKTHDKRPFKDSDYDSLIHFVFGMVDASHVYGIEKDMTYNLIYNVIMQDPYYSNHKGEGESFIRNRFENAWNNYNPNRLDRRTYMTVNKLMCNILHV